MHRSIPFYCLVLLVFVSSCGINKSSFVVKDIDTYVLENKEKISVNDSLFFKGKSSFRKNRFGQWELIAFGNNPRDLGNNIGHLTETQLIQQEEIFLSKIDKMVPSKLKQYLLRKFLAFYNRDLHKYIQEEYKAEMYGVSRYASNDSEKFASKYAMSLYLHSAHDLGHALQDLALVGCSSFASWGENTADGGLIIGRNFDFYLNDDFAKEKIIAFVQPEKGYKYMSVSWAGMIGVMSGMNDQGLTVTINAGKSNIPLLAKTPISLVSREILQYAATLEEAIAIAKQKEVFVSESLMIGSAIDNSAVLIEISPKNFGVYRVDNNSQLICSNHFQSKAYKNDDRNTAHISNSHSKYRYDRMVELLEGEIMTPEKAVGILRNKEGLLDKKIGYGNEKSLNQLLAHHAIVFQPHKKTVWVSSNPYQLGAFTAYNLDSVFSNYKTQKASVSMEALRIKKDPFLFSDAYKMYEQYRKEKRNLAAIILENKYYPIEKINNFILLNPSYWESYYLVGCYYYNKKQYQAALDMFTAALDREITTVPNRKEIEKYIKKIKRRLHDS
ncbi:MAG: acyl-CoA--6-aminopenicillanic acid acyl-transferase [Flavobacteriaceae bacterium]|nr:acyl-CoA--6-aminopenicillanic acid acyl-transferase [Flavobacteriaceae bacterium]